MREEVRCSVSNYAYTWVTEAISRFPVILLGRSRAAAKPVRTVNNTQQYSFCYVLPGVARAVGHTFAM